MKKIFFLIFIYSFLILIQEGSAQTPQTLPYNYNFDSLVYANEQYLKEDMVKLKMLNQLTLGYSKTNPAKGIVTGEQAIGIAQKLDHQLLLAEAFNNKGLNHNAKAEFLVAMELYEKAQKINQIQENVYGMACNRINIGDIYRQKGDSKKTLSHFEEALNLFEKINNKEGMAKSYNAIGNAYYSLLFDDQKALEYYEKALSINDQIGNKTGMAANLSNLGNVYQKLSDYPKALQYYQKALTINEQLGNKNYIAANLGNMGNAYYNLSIYPKALEYLRKALNIHEQLGSKYGISSNLSGIGNVYTTLAEYPKALEYYQRALNINEQIGNKNSIADNLVSIANSYNNLNDYTHALEYYQKALSQYQNMGNRLGVAACFSYLGVLFHNLSDSDCTKFGISSTEKNIKAIEYLQKGLSLYEQLESNSGMASALGFLGEVVLEAPDIVLLKIGVKPVERFVKALEYINNAMEINISTSDNNGRKENWRIFSEIYEKQGNYTKAHEAYKNYITLRDSIIGAEVKSEIQQKELQFEFDKKETQARSEFQHSQDSIQFANSKRELMLQKEMQLEALKYEYEKRQASAKSEKERQQLKYEEELKRNQINYDYEQKTKAIENKQLQKQAAIKADQEKRDAITKKELERQILVKNGFIFGFAGVLLFAGVFLRQRNKIKKGKKRSDELLLNILPFEVAEELKDTGSAVAKNFKESSVMFTDFKDFTRISEKLTPTELVAEIHTCFEAFDHIITKYNIEKIKTIGDSYMCVAGLPNANNNHASDITKAALEILKFMENYNKEKLMKGGIPFEIRIGINSGPVVAGIVGVKKFAYDIWGDTVNLASRMESKSEAGKINISGPTYEKIKDKFNCTHRGKIDVKGKGEVNMYFVNSLI